MRSSAKSRIWIAIALFLIATGCKGPETVAAKTSRTGTAHMHYYKTR